MNSSLTSPVVEIDLSRFDTLVQNETTERPKSDTIPDGRYEVRIEDAELTKSVRTGNPMLKYTLRVLGPTHANRVLWKRSGITENSVQYVMEDLKLCGLHLQKFSDLNRNIHELIGVELEVTKRTKGEFADIYFNKAAGAADKRAVDEDDDLPF